MGLIVNFSDFENISASGLSLNDYIIGYKSGPNREIRTTIADLINFLESASANDLYLVLSPNSAKWNSAYSTVNSLSDSWEESVYITPLQNASGSWDSAYNTLNANSAAGISVYSTVKDNSGYWNESYTNLVNNSASYLGAVDLSLVATTSSSWNSAYSTLNANSANWTNVSVISTDATFLSISADNFDIYVGKILNVRSGSDLRIDFESSLPAGFNLSVLNETTNNVTLTSSVDSVFKSFGTVLSGSNGSKTLYSSATVYKYGANVFAIGSLV